MECVLAKKYIEIGGIKVYKTEKPLSSQSRAFNSIGISFF